MNDEVLLSKAESIERCLRRVRDTYAGHEGDFVENFTVQDVCLLNLQRACEAAIDMANRSLKLHRLRYPRDSKDSFKHLAQAGLIANDVAAAMTAMVGFRNIAVHEYRELDLEKVRLIIDHRLDDLLAFSKAMLKADPTP